MSERNKSVVPKGSSSVVEFDPQGHKELVLRGLSDIEAVEGVSFPLTKEFWKKATLEEVEGLINRGGRCERKE